MKGIVQSQRTKIKLLAAFIPDKSKEEKAADELFENYPELEAHYKKLVEDLELTITAGRFIEDVSKVWTGVTSRHTVLQQFVSLVKEQRQTISSLNSEVGDCLRSTKDKQDNVEKLKMEIEKAWRTADATHVREQEALENIENLRQQLSRLQNERGGKSKMDFDQNGEYTTAAKNREMQLKERDKLNFEMAELKEKLKVLTAEHEELEQRYSVANMKVAELQQDLENRGNEIMKETQFKGRLQDEINRLTDEMRGRTEEVLVHKLQMTMLNRTANRLEQALKAEKATVDRLTQQQEVLSQRYLKIQDELSIETQLYEEASSKINLLANQLKNKDEELLKYRNDLSRVVKLTESAAVRIEKAEGERKRVEEERDALLTKCKSLEREVAALNRLRTVDERLVEKTARERQLERNNCLRLNDELKGLFKRIEVSEQIRQRFQTDNEELCKEILKLRRQIRNLENEMERVQEGEKGLMIKLDGVEENLRSKIRDIADLKKQLTETDAVVKQQQTLFETVRTEKNAVAKELFQCQGEIEGLQEKTKLMTSQIEQLKGDIANKEDLLTKEELAFRKAQTEKECLRADVQRWRDAVKDSKRAANLLQDEVKDIKHSMKECEFEINRLNVEKKHVMNEKIAISKQLLNATQENELLNEKVKIFQATIDKGKTLYAKRLHDIRLLKFEIEQLRKEKGNLSKALNNTTDFRSEIYHLERDLAKERLKSKALEEELQTPLNVHRWRKLEGSDPSKLELIQKIHILQKRLVRGISTIEEQEKKYLEVEQKYEVLKLKFCRQPTPQASQQLYKVQITLRKKIQTIKRLTTKVNVLVSRNTELKHNLECANTELNNLKKLYFDQKRKEDKYKQQLADMKKLNYPENDDMALPPIKSNVFVSSVLRQSF